MSGLFGKKSQSTTDQRYNALQLTQSSYGQPVSWIRGRTRIPPSLLWFDDFKSTPHSQSSGGKGGGGGGGSTSYTYSAAMILLLGEGVLTGVNTVFADKAQHTLADLGLTFFSGTTGQAVWSYLTTNHPGAAIPYSDMGFVAGGSLQLGASAGVPNLTFEVDGGLAFNFGGGIFDAEASDLVIDYLTGVKHGAGFTHLGTLQGVGNTWQTWCIANGFFFSPQETTQRAASDWLREILDITNSNCINSAGVLNIIPYADAAVTGNGRTFTPNLTPIFSFNDGDYCPQPGDDPVQITITSPKKLYNVVNVEFLDRANNYNPAIATATDAADIAVNGRRVMNTLSYHEITSGPLALLVARLKLQRQLYIRRSFTTRVRADYSLLEGMDLIELTDSNTGLVNQLARVTQTEDDEDDYFTITAEEVPIGPASAPQYSWQANAGFSQNYAAAPGSVQAPVMFMMPPLMVDAANGGYQVAIATCGNSGLWGGCDVYWSLDNSTFKYVGSITQPARYGSLTATFGSGADPDTTNALQVLLANTALSMASATQADADNLRTPIWVDGEIVSYQYCTLTAAGAYTFTSTGLVGGTKYMRRGKYGSTIASHANASKFARMDDCLFRIAFDPGLIGQPIYFKFCSFNIYGGGNEQLGSVSSYSYTPSSANVGQVLAGPGAMTARANCVISGRTVSKNGGAFAFDSDCYSQAFFSNGAFVSFKVRAGHVVVGLATNPTASLSYTAIDFGIEVNLANGNVYIWIGSTSNNTLVFTGVAVATDSYEVRYDAVTARLFRNGALFYAFRAPGLSLATKVAIGDPGSSVSDIAFGPTTGVGIVGGNYLSTMPWIIGGAGSIGTGEGNYHASIANPDAGIFLGGTSAKPLGPYGGTDPLWYTDTFATGLMDGGWENTGDLQGIDPTKTYRSCVWFFIGNTTGAASFYHGCDTGGATLDLSGAADSNPYFSAIPVTSLTNGKWYLSVGIIHGSGYGSTPSGVSGIYDPVTGALVAAGTDYKMAPGFTYQMHRTYLYGATATGGSFVWTRPRFEEVNGAEPSISLLLSPNGALAYLNQTDTPNIVDGAATDLYEQLASSATDTSGALGDSQDVLSITVPAHTYDYVAIITFSGNLWVATSNTWLTTLQHRVGLGGTGLAGGHPTATASPGDATTYRANFFVAGGSGAQTFVFSWQSTGVATINGSNMHLQVEVVKK